MRERVGLALCLVVLFCADLALGSQEAARIEWGSRIPWTPSVGLENLRRAEETGIQVVPTLGASLPGRIRTFALADTALYAFFLEEPQDLSMLAEALDAPGGPPEWEQRFDNGDLSPLLDRPAHFERIDLEPNGRLTVLADANLHPGMRVLAVVNGDGDILGSRLIWSDAATLLP